MPTYVLNAHYLQYVPNQEKCIIFGCQWLRVEWKPSKQLVWASGEQFATSLTILAPSKIVCNLSYATVPATNKSIINILLEYKLEFIYSCSYFLHEDQLTQYTFLWQVMPCRFASALGKHFISTFWIFTYPVIILPMLIHSLSSRSESCAHFRKSSSGWSSCLLAICLTVDFHFAAMSSA